MERPKEFSTKDLSRDTIAPRVNEDYLLQVPEEIEWGLTEKLSPKFSKIEGRNLSALSEPDEFCLNSHVRVEFGTIPEASQIFD